MELGIDFWKLWLAQRNELACNLMCFTRPLINSKLTWNNTSIIKNASIEVQITVLIILKYFTNTFMIDEMSLDGILLSSSSKIISSQPLQASRGLCVMFRKINRTTYFVVFVNFLGQINRIKKPQTSLTIIIFDCCNKKENGCFWAIFQKAM